MSRAGDQGDRALEARLSALEGELAEAQSREQRRAETLHALIRAHEDERARIARELHDSAAQAIASVLLSLELASQQTTLDAMKERLADLRDVVSMAASDIRRISHELRPPLLDDMGLKLALERYCGDAGARAGTPIDVSVAITDGRLDAEVETVLYRIVQEAVTDALTLGSPQRIDVSLEAGTDDLRLVVTDDAPRPQPVDRIGMRERAELIGGTFSIRSIAGGGTIIELEVPRS